MSIDDFIDAERKAAYKRGYKNVVPVILMLLENRMRQYENDKQFDEAMALDLAIFEIKDYCFDESQY